MSNFLLQNFWHTASPQPEPTDGLATVRAAVLALEAGLAVPSREAAHLLQALRPLLAAGGDLDVASRLGLRTTRGKRHAAPTMRERLLRRDSLIRQMFERMNAHQAGPAEASALALQILWTWCRVSDTAQPQPTGPLLELATEFEILSVRQILRIFKNELAYAAGH